LFGSAVDLSEPVQEAQNPRNRWVHHLYTLRIKVWIYIVLFVGGVSV
jgi:hypothetical protein